MGDFTGALCSRENEELVNMLDHQDNAFRNGHPRPTNCTNRLADGTGTLKLGFKSKRMRGLSHGVHPL